MTNKTVAVIGAGISGLSAGCYAQMNGYDTTIFELNKGPGGVAAWWRRKDYLIDGGIHFVSMAKPDLRIHNLYREVGIDKVSMKEMDFYLRFQDSSTGRKIDITSDLDALRADLCSMFPEDQGIANGFVSAAKTFAKTDTTNLGLDKPIELMSLKDRLSEMWAMRGLLKYMSGSHSQTIEKYAERVKDPLFREFLKMIFLPTVPVWFVSMILGQLAAGQMAFLEEGSQDFIRTMEARYLDLGGSVEYNAEVQRILVESGKAVGVQLKDDSEHQMDSVIPAIDGYSIVYDLLGGRFVNEKINYMYKNWALISPVLIVSYGVHRDFQDEPAMAVWKLEHPITIAQESIDYFTVRIFNHGRGFSPPGKTVVQVEMNTDWNYWYNLRTSSKESYRDEKMRIANMILHIVEEQYPGISELVEITDVATPYTTWRYTHNREGAYMGWMPTKNLLTTRLKKTLPGLRSCFLAGQWAMGMGGVLASIHSGRHAVQLLCHQDGKPFKTLT